MLTKTFKSIYISICLVLIDESALYERETLMELGKNINLVASPFCCHGQVLFFGLGLSFAMSMHHHVTMGCL